MDRARVVVCTALLIYVAGIFVLAVFPLSTVTIPGLFLGVVCIFVAIGLVAHATPQIVLPGEKYAYLMTGFLGLSTLFSYLLVGIRDPVDHRIGVSFLLVCGIVGSYGAYLEQEED